MKQKKVPISTFQVRQKQIDSIFEYFSAPDIRYSSILNPDKFQLYTQNPKITQNHLAYFNEVSKEILFFIPRVIVELSSATLKHFFYRKNYVTFKENNWIEKDSVFISHYTNARKPQNNFDAFFGSLPFHKASQRNLILLIDHSAKKNGIRKFERFNHLNEKYLLLPKTCSNKLFLKILTIQIRNFFYIMYRLVSVMPKIDNDLKLYLEVARNQVSRAAINNYILLYNLIFVLEKVKATQILMTYEGHAYESFVINKIKTKFKEAKIHLYQHAPVVKSQHTFFRNLSYLPSDVKIFVTGKRIKEMILKSDFQVMLEILILGSFKRRNKRINVKNRKKPLHVLIAVENDQKTSQVLTALSKALCENFRDAKFTLRLHPDFIIERGNAEYLNLNNYPNLNLSSSSLEHDLLENHVCIYNSSSISIECLPYHVEPIHYSCYPNLDLDPIQLVDLPHERINGIDCIINRLNYKSDNRVMPLSYLSKMDKAYDRYYARANIKEYFQNIKY
jgi:hypothetical protein